VQDASLSHGTGLAGREELELYLQCDQPMVRPDSLATINSLLSAKTCEDYGILPLVVTSDLVVLGAMNPEMREVTKICDALKNTVKNVETKQITTEEWEKWFASESNRSTIPIDSSYYIPISKIKEDHDTTINNQHLTLNSEHNSATDSSVVSEGNSVIDGVVLLNKDEDIVSQDSITFADLTSESQADSLDADLTASDAVVRGVAEILRMCESVSSSDIHIEPQEERLRVRYRIDGILQEKFEFPKSMISGIIARTKILSKLDVAEKRVPQDGRLRIAFKGINYDFRVSTLPGNHGEKIVLRALRSDNTILNLDKLITEKPELALIREIGDNPYGIFIVVGPTGSGKSTTLYSILSEHNNTEINISTVEDPIEYTLPGLHQCQVVREKGLDFARALRALMRQDPDVILVGETRDKETAQVAMEAALTGHMVFTTLHANDSATAVTRLAEMGVPPYLVGASVVGVLAQRLMRKVCPQCSTEVSADPEDKFLRKYNITKHKRADVKVGGLHHNETNTCPVCKGTGYKGRIGVYEVLKVDDDIRHCILKGDTSDQIREASRSKGMRTLLEYGMELVKKGLSTIEEVERVCVLETDDDSTNSAEQDQYEVHDN